MKEWLWVFTNQDFCLFRAADTRSRAELESQLATEYSGVISSDEYSVYNGYPVKAQQKCFAHRHRHFQRLIQLPGENNQAMGKAFKDLIDEGFRLPCSLFPAITLKINPLHFPKYTNLTKFHYSINYVTTWKIKDYETWYKLLPKLFLKQLKVKLLKYSNELWRIKIHLLQ